MKFKKIVGFGDSWIWGDELIDPQLRHRDDAHPVLIENVEYREDNCFLGLLGQHYGVPVENFGIPGGSQQSAMWTYLWWLEHEILDPKECLILIGHTESNRVTFYNPRHISYSNDPPWNKFVHSAWIHCGNSDTDQDWVNMVKLHMVLTDSIASRELTYRQSVTFFEGQYYKFGGNVLQFNIMEPELLITATGLIWNNSGLRNLVRNQPALLAPQEHPNEQGHLVIRDHLINQIDRVILDRC
jgi:hypothetical protein